MKRLNEVIQTINQIAEGIKPLSIAVAGIALVVIGLLWMFAKDPQKKEMYTGWFVNVAIGFAIVWLGASIVTWLGTKTVGFSG